MTEPADEIGEPRLRDADELVAVNGAFMFESLGDPNSNLCGKPVVR